MKTFECPGVKSDWSIFLQCTIDPSMERLVTSSTPRGRWIAESAHRAENLGAGKEFNIIMPKDTTAERKLAVILGLIRLDSAAHDYISVPVDVFHLLRCISLEIKAGKKKKAT